MAVLTAAVGILGALTVHLGCQQVSPPPSARRGVAESHSVRVRIVADTSQIKLTATDRNQQVIATVGGVQQPLRLPPRTPILVSATPAGWQIGTASLPPGELLLGADPVGTLAVEGRAYRGTYKLVPMRAGGTFDVVNHVDVEDYLKGVLAAELHAEFHPEAFAAQAIIARTYALYTRQTTPASRHWDLHSDVRSQMYGGIRTELPRSIQAVEATAGLVVAHGAKGDERIFKTYYSSCCGGVTTSAAEVFGEPAIAPFTPKAVGNRCDIASPPYKARFNWGPVTISKTEVSRRLRLWGKNNNHPLKDNTGIRRIDVASTNAPGRPIQYAVEDARGTRHLIAAEQLRLAVNTDAASEASKLSSGWVVVNSEGASFVFNGRGFGHGVGACQWCLEAEARQGIKADAIVRDAFPGAVLIKAY